MSEKPKEMTSRPLRYRPWGSVLLSWDFYVGVPVGLVASGATLFSLEVRESMPYLLIGIAGVGAALATLVLTSLTVLLSTISDDYRRLLDQLPRGSQGVTKPFQIVVWCAVATTALALVGAGFMPMVTGTPWLAFLLAAPAHATLMWSLLGCVQIVGMISQHWRYRDRATDLADRKRRAQGRAS